METTLCIVRNGNKILLATKKRGFGTGIINSAGGKLEPGETPEQAMVRETQEEIGITPTKYEKVGKLTFDENFKGERIKFDCHLYLATEWTGKPKESDEMKPKWFKISKIPYGKMWGDDKFWLPLVLTGEKTDCYFKFDDDYNMVDFKVEKMK